MSRKALAVIGYIMATILVVGGTVLLVAYGNGYTYSFKTGKLVQRGLLLLDSAPNGASVQLDNRSINETTPFRRTLEEGTYNFNLERNGFHTWAKPVDVVPSRVSQHKYVLLIPKKLITSQIATFPAISQTVASRDKRRLAFVVPTGDQAGLWVMDTGSRRPVRVYTPAVTPNPEQLETITILEWSFDSSRVLVRRNNGTENSLLVVSNNANESPVSISDTFGVNPETLVFSPNNRQLLYWHTEGGLRRLDVGNATVTNLITANVAGYGFSEDRILYVNTATSPASLWVLESDGERKKLASKVPSGSSFSIASENYLGKSAATVVATDTRKAMLYRDIFDEIIIRELALSAVRAEFTVDGRFAMFTDDKHISTYDLQEKKTYRIYEGTTSVTGVTWFGNYHLLYTKDSKAVLSEFDGNYSHVLSTVDAHAPTATANTKAVIVSSPTPSGSVQLKLITVRQ